MQVMQNISETVFKPNKFANPFDSSSTCLAASSFFICHGRTLKDKLTCPDEPQRDIYTGANTSACADIYHGLYLTMRLPILAEQTTMDAFIRVRPNRLFCAFMSSLESKTAVELLAVLLLRNVWLFRGGLVLS